MGTISERMPQVSCQVLEKDLSLGMPPAFMRESISLYDEK